MGLREPDSGNVSVLGLNPIRSAAPSRSVSAFNYSKPPLPDRMKVWEALDLYSSFYTNTIPWEPLLEEWGLGDKRNAVLSTCPAARSNACLSLWRCSTIRTWFSRRTDDWPRSAGARRSTWDLVADIRDRGKTVVLVTQLWMKRKRCAITWRLLTTATLSRDTPARLIEQVDDELRVTLRWMGHFRQNPLQFTAGQRHLRSGRRWTARGDADNLLQRVVIALEQNAVRVTNLQTERASSKTCSSSITGRQIRA